MPYLGNAPSATFQSVAYQDLTGGTGTSFTLSHAVSSAQEIEVFVNNVRQEPTVAYTVAGTTLTMTGTIAATDDFYVVFQGKAVGSVSHPTTSPLAATTGNFTGNVTSSGTVTATSFSGDGSALTGVSAGKVLQVVHQTLSTTSSHAVTANTYVDTSLTASITPASSSNKILVMGQFLNGGAAGNLPNYLRVVRVVGATTTAVTQKLGHFNYVSNMENFIIPAVCNVLDSPSTTSAITYKVQITRVANGTIYFNGNYQSGQNDTFDSHLTLIEIEG